MGAKTGIEWTDATWTPIRARFLEIQDDGSGKERIGWHCEHASPGCVNCYSESINLRLGTGLPFRPDQLFRQERVGYHNGEAKLFLDEDMLLAPLRWKKPRMVFVCSMTDLFADFVPDEWIDRIFAVMALCPLHTFQVLTKRAERMRKYMADNPVVQHAPAWPLPNVWLGVSVEDQRRADERIPHLLATPATVRFLSCEPLLDEINLRGWETHDWRPAAPGEIVPRIDWVIVGGESGPHARPYCYEWAHSIIRQCADAGVPCFHKQVGAHPVGFDGRRVHLRDRKGSDPELWPEELRVRQMPHSASGGMDA